MKAEKMISPTERMLRRLERRSAELAEAQERDRLDSEQRMAVRAVAGTVGGRVLIERWESEMDDAQGALVTVDPEDVKRIVYLQTRIRDRLFWLEALTGSK